MSRHDSFERVEREDILKTLSNHDRFTILTWLLEPEKHFKPQEDAELVEHVRTANSSP